MCIFFQLCLFIWGGDAHAIAHVWRSEDNLEESVLSLNYVGPGIQLRSSGLIASFFTCWASSLALNMSLLNR